jgi:hypothetical protein
MKLLSTYVVACASIVFMLQGCATRTIVHPSPSDLIGYSTGGREGSWLFREGQIEHFRVESHPSTDSYIVALVLRQYVMKGKKFYARVLLTYDKSDTLVSVGLLYLEQLKPTTQ